MPEHLRLGFAGLYEKDEEGHWQLVMKLETKLDEKGFEGDEDVVALGLEEMEDEMTLAEATRLYHLAKSGVEVDRRKAIAIPVSSATVDEARQAREAEHAGDRGEEIDGDE